MCVSNFNLTHTTLYVFLDVLTFVVIYDDGESTYYFYFFTLLCAYSLTTPSINNNVLR